MKILILSDDFPPYVNGGAAVVAARLASAYVRKGHDVRVVTTVRDKMSARTYAHERIRVHAFYSEYHIRWQAYRSLYNWSILPKVRDVICDFKPDAVHAHNIHYHISYHALKLAKRSGARVVLTAHDCMLFHYGKLREYIDFSDTVIPKKSDYRVSLWGQMRTYKRRYNPLRNFVIRRYLRYCDQVCAVSHALRDALEANGIHDSIVIYNGIDHEVWKPSMRSEQLVETRRAYGLEGKKAILFAGRLSVAKGGAETLRVLAGLSKKIPNVVLLAAGTRESFMQTMGPLAKQLGVEHLVVSTGWVDESRMRALYEISDVVVFPSEYLDAFGLVNIEAMAMEKPVVATCFGGAPEIVENGVTGAIVNPFNIGSFSAEVGELIVNSQKARAFGSAGRLRVKRFFSLERQAENYLALFGDI